MLDALTDIIGYSYTGHEMEWIICCMFIFWALYMVMTFLYVALGLNK